MPIESIRHGHIELLRLGADAEVLGPPELRERFTGTVRGMTLTTCRECDMTMPDDQLAYNRKLIEEFRADGGKSMGDRPLLLLTTVGRRTGEPHTSPMMFVRIDDRLLVIASNAAPRRIRTGTPTWSRTRP